MLCSNSSSQIHPESEFSKSDSRRTPVKVHIELEMDCGKSFICYEEPNVLGPQEGYGYCPLHIGQLVNEGKLEIVRKLGWATSSTVWLARTHGNVYPVQYVALKVLSISSTAAVVYGHLHEPQVLHSITMNNTVEHKGQKHCVQFFGYFFEKSSQGPHLCIVTEVLGKSLSELSWSLDSKSQHHHLPLPLVKQVTKQLLLALDYLHRVCRIVHTDVKPENILVYLHNVNEVIEDTLRLEPSRTYPIQHEPLLSHEPIVTIMSQPLSLLTACSNLNNLIIKLTDLGEAVPTTRSELHRNIGLGTPTLLRAPEIILDFPCSTPIDIWSVGCMAFHLLVGVELFQLHGSTTAQRTDVHLARMVEHLGPFPTEFLSECAKRSNYFCTSGKLLRVNPSEPLSIKECLKRYNILSDDDISPAAAFIQECLTIDPRARPTAEQLLQDPWIATI